MQKFFSVICLGLLFFSCGNIKDKNPQSKNQQNTEVLKTVGKAVDLGLNVLWSDRNLGAIAEEEAGSYFAWGESLPKDEYDWSNYKYAEGMFNKLTKYCNDKDYGKVDGKMEYDAEDDAAVIYWGGNWRTPTKEDMEELRDKCTWEQTTQNGKNGFKVTGANGNSIFLPLTGYYLGKDLLFYGTHATYATKSLHDKFAYRTHVLELPFKKNTKLGNHRIRSMGRTLRPVFVK